MKKRPNLTENQFDRWAGELREWIQDSVSPFENDTPTKQKRRITRAKNDKLFFMKTYLPHYFSVKFGEFHKEWAEFGAMRNDVALIAAPREHAKSTFFTLGDLVYDACFSLRHFILVGSDTHDQATAFVLAIRLEFEDNRRLKHDFELVPGRTWKNDEFVINDLKYMARGKKDKWRGLKFGPWRPDKAVLDDWENDENVRNPRLVQQGRELIQGTILGAMGDGFACIMIGNLFHPKSVMSQMISEKDEAGKPRYRSKIYRAVLDAGTENERPLWPALWSLKRLAQKKHLMGSRAFNAEMMQLVSDEDSPFKEEWFRYYQRSDISGVELETATFVDPSAKNNEGSDYKAVITVALDRNEMKFYCLHAWIRRASVGEMFAAAYAQHEAYASRVGIEENMFKDFLHEAIQNYARQAGQYLPWIAVHHTANKEGRIIGTLSYLVEYGKLRFEQGHSDQDTLVEQLVYILNRNVHDDGPDALEGAVSLLQGCGPAMQGQKEPPKRKRESVRRGGFGRLTRGR